VLDCDVLQADGGTRTASITGAFVALALALRQFVEFGRLKTMPVLDFVAATSVGLVDGVPMLDLLLRRRFPRGGGHERRDDRRRPVR